LVFEDAGGTAVAAMGGDEAGSWRGVQPLARAVAGAPLSPGKAGRAAAAFAVGQLDVTGEDDQGGWAGAGAMRG
jgi:hypothetical protein